MRTTISLFLVLLLLLLSPLWAEESLGKTREALEAVESYRANISCRTNFSAEHSVTMESKVWGARPDLFRLDSEMVDGKQSLETVMVFDGTWQWVDSKATSGNRQERKIVKVDTSIARPGKPFDTFLYLTGSGLFAGEDYLSTCQELLNLYQFGEPTERDGFRVYEGGLSQEAFDRYLQERGQLGLGTLFTGSMDACRLYVDPRTGLPTGYDIGENLEQSFIEARFSGLETGVELSPSVFSYEPPKGHAVFDATAETARSRVSSSQIEPGSDLFQIVGQFIKEADNPTPPELEELLFNEDYSAALALIEKNPELLQTETASGNQPLFSVLSFGPEEIALRLLELGADPKHQSMGGTTSLHIAAQRGFPEVVKRLLSMGVDLEARNSRGQTPLHLAEDPEVIALLLGAGANEEVVDIYGSRPYVVENRAAVFVKAIAEGDSAGIERGLEQNVPLDVPVEIVGWYPQSPLQAATRNGKGSLQRFWSLYAAEAEPDARKRTASELLYSVIDTETLQYLLDQGADPNFLLGESCPLMAINNPMAWEILLEAGADPSLRMPDGRSVLVASLTTQSLAANFELADLLLKKGAEPGLLFSLDETEDSLGQVSLLHFAVLKENEGLMEWALGAGLDPDLQTGKGWTALNIAASGAQLQMVRKLHQAGASLDKPDENGWTPLHSASYLGGEEVVVYLLSEGAKPNLKDNLGNTPLHLASHVGKFAIVRSLLENGAEPEARNRDGETAADLLPEHASPQLKRLLKK